MQAIGQSTYTNLNQYYDGLKNSANPNFASPHEQIKREESAKEDPAEKERDISLAIDTTGLGNRINIKI